MNGISSLWFLTFVLDANECEASNGGCQHHCVNNNGSYICQCNKGFVLDHNGKSCTGKLKIQVICENCFKLWLLVALIKELLRTSGSLLMTQ